MSKKAPPRGAYLAGRECQACGLAWDALGIEDSGAFFLVYDEDADCPECGAEGEWA